MGLSNGTRTSDWTSHCYNFGGNVLNGRAQSFTCNTNNVGRYFYIRRNTGGWYTSTLAVCEVELQGVKGWKVGK